MHNFSGALLLFVNARHSIENQCVYILYIQCSNIYVYIHSVHMYIYPLCTYIYLSKFTYTYIFFPNIRVHIHINRLFV